MKQFVTMVTWILLGFVFIASQAAASSSGIGYVGNRILPSRSGVEVSGVTFLLSNPNPYNGIAFAYSAHIRERSTIRFQIWRNTKSTSDRDFFLVSELVFLPSVLNQREDVYVESRLTEDCTAMLPGDRFGIYFEERPSAISYVFDGAAPDALGHTLSNASEPTLIGQTVTFDALVFPYDFSAAVWVFSNATVDENNTNSLVDCPRGLKIPPYSDDALPSTTPAPPLTGAPGATGLRGPLGPRGSTGQIGPMGVPGLVGPMGAIGPMGKQGYNGTRGGQGATGEQGDDGDHGAMGATGPLGQKGDTGMAGPPGPPGQAANNTGSEGPEMGASTTAEVNLLSETIILILLIWLAVITFLLLVMIIVVCCLCRRRKPDYDKFSRESAYNDYLNNYHNNLPKGESQLDDPLNKISGTNGGLNGKTAELAIPRGLGSNVNRTDSTNSFGWMGSMREDETTEYSVDTILKMSSKRNANHEPIGQVNMGMADDGGKKSTVSREELTNY